MKSKPSEWLAPDDDNRRLSNLCGPLNKNIEHIEKSLGVKITRRGGRLQIAGDKLPSQQAIEIINRFFAVSQQPIEPEDIELALVEVRDAALNTSQAISNAASEFEHDEIDEDEPISLKTRKVDLQARTASQKEYLRTILSHDLTFGIGPAGTGKTYLAVACVVDALERDAVRRIVLTRPAVEAGERLGFLPGDLAQKIDPYLRPLYDSLYDLLGYERVQKLFDKNMIEIAPLAYMRGRTLNHAFVILDEAQNTTPEQMKMFLTRIGFGTKAVITGDVTQIDLPRGQKSGLIQAQQVLKEVPEIGFCRFMNRDVVRHPLVGKIVDAYDHFLKKQEIQKDE